MLRCTLEDELAYLLGITMGKKKSAGPGIPQPKDNQSIAIGLLPVLTEQFEQAKAEKNHVESNKLRKQIWVVTDYSHGVVPDMPDEELKEIIKDLPLALPGQEPADNKGPQVVQGSAPSSNSGQNRLNKLRTRLAQIDKLKEKQAAGEKLEKNQVDKIGTEDDVRKQIAELEELIASCS